MAGRLRRNVTGSSLIFHSVIMKKLSTPCNHMASLHPCFIQSPPLRHPVLATLVSACATMFHIQHHIVLATVSHPSPCTTFQPQDVARSFPSDVKRFYYKAATCLGCINSFNTPRRQHHAIHRQHSRLAKQSAGMQQTLFTRS